MITREIQMLITEISKILDRLTSICYQLQLRVLSSLPYALLASAWYGCCLRGLDQGQ